jgi:hypothetical protein
MAKPTPQEIQDLRDAPKLEKAYNDASSTRMVDNFPDAKASLQRAFAEKRKEAAGIEMESKRREEARAEKGKNFKENMEAGRMDAMGNAYKNGGSVRSASSRADGIAQRGKTRGRMC